MNASRLLILIGFALSSQYALAREHHCASMPNEAKSYCELAMSFAKSGGTSDARPGMSVAQTAAAQSVASGNTTAALKDAITYCESQKELCEEVCTGQNLGNSGTKCSAAIAAGRLGPEIKCTPLVIQMGEAPIELTPPADGIDFDIAGRNARPTPHAPVRISWLTPESRVDNYFLTLPTAEGRVLGIDELFGNNTFGPDSDFATNGFEALKKHDELRDGVIDARDPVFARLRLWHDLNGDGLAQPEELVTLDALGIASIDLEYDPDYAEWDRFGNGIITKSTVRLINDELRLIFDLWFN